MVENESLVFFFFLPWYCSCQSRFIKIKTFCFKHGTSVLKSVFASDSGSEVFVPEISLWKFTKIKNRRYLEALKMIVYSPSADLSNIFFVCDVRIRSSIVLLIVTISLNQYNQHY
uniref:Uncharacterized protein n=1 Tax=Cacopsylla melanoneura TaxID=428564 RepID=A0A8D9BIC7_9HEMI